MTHSQWVPPLHPQYDTHMCSVERGPTYWGRYECSGTPLAKCNVHYGTLVCHILSIIAEGGEGGGGRGGRRREGEGGGERGREEERGGGRREGEVMGAEKRREGYEVPCPNCEPVDHLYEWGTQGHLKGRGGRGREGEEGREGGGEEEESANTLITHMYIIIIKSIFCQFLKNVLVVHLYRPWQPVGHASLASSDLSTQPHPL